MPEAIQSPETIRARLDEVRQRVEASAQRSHRAPEEVRIIAVTKTHPLHVIQQAIEAGARDFGENRIQEAEEKIEKLGHANARWHLIGHLQSNKARRAVQYFDCIHSVDSGALAERLNRLCTDENRDELPILIQVDLAGEATKSGVSETELPEVVATIRNCERLRLMGLMTLPPFFENAELVRPYFRRLREIRDALRSQDIFKAGDGELSMGMSHDYEVATEEGATMVRIGTAIFGAGPAAL